MSGWRWPAREGENGQHLGPADLGVADPDVAQGDQQHQVQRQVADQRGKRDRDPATRHQADGAGAELDRGQIPAATGGRRTSRSSAEATRPASARTGAPRSSLAASARTADRGDQAGHPEQGGDDPPGGAALEGTRARASTGRPSLMKLFQTPETSTAVVPGPRVAPRPQHRVGHADADRRPDPAGTVLATAVVDWVNLGLRTAGRRDRRPHPGVGEQVPAGDATRVAISSQAGPGSRPTPLPGRSRGELE